MVLNLIEKKANHPKDRFIAKFLKRRLYEQEIKEKGPGRPEEKEGL